MKDIARFMGMALAGSLFVLGYWSVAALLEPAARSLPGLRAAGRALGLDPETAIHLALLLLTIMEATGLLYLYEAYGVARSGPERGLAARLGLGLTATAAALLLGLALWAVMGPAWIRLLRGPGTLCYGCV